MTTWEKIWNNEDRLNEIILDCLIRCDGFDTLAGKFQPKNWLEYSERLIELAEINTNDSVFEIGCGSGAFLYSLYLKNYEIGGCDYSSPLIKIAKRFMPEGEFILSEASELKLHEEKFNAVISHSIFFYFKNLEYAENVFKKMIQFSSDKIAIFDINDQEKSENYYLDRMNKFLEQGGTRKEYEQKYKNLNHLFYEKEWFINLAKKYNLKVKIIDQDYKKYGYAKYRFNAIYQK